MSTQKSNTVVAVAAIFIAVIIIVFAIVKGKSTPSATPDQNNTNQALVDETIPPAGNQSDPKAEQNIARIDQSTSLTPSATDSNSDEIAGPNALTNAPATKGAATQSPTVNNTKPNTLLTFAALGDIAQLQQKIESGADLDAQDQSGRTALMAAADKGQLDAVFALLNAGANPALRDNSRRAARDYALARYDQVGKKIARILEDATGPVPVSGPNDK